MMDLEDGELPSSDNEDSGQGFDKNVSSAIPEILDDTDYVILDRPRSEFIPNSTAPSTTTSSSSSLPTSAFEATSLTSPVNQASTSQSMIPTPFEFNDSYGMRGKKAYYNNMGVSDLMDSSGKDSSSASDSDDDGGAFAGKRSRMTNIYSSQPDIVTSNSAGMTMAGAFGGASSAFGSFESQPINFSGGIIDNPQSSSEQGLNAFYAEAAKFQQQHQQQRKPNLVWANVMQEEQISNIFEGVKVDEPGLAHVEVTRGPETYSFQRPMRQPRERRESDSSDISSGGLSDNALHYLRDGCSFDEEETGESSEHSLPLSFRSSAPRNTNSRKCTKQRRTRQKYKRKLIAKLKKMKAPELGQYMAKKLLEEKVQLLVRAVEILGKENCIHIFLKTLKIERRGGVMVKNQKRRRTPGGVFLYLVRGDRRFPKSQIDLIFRDDRAIHDKFKRKKQVAKRLRAKAKLENALDDIDSTKDDFNDSEDTAVPEREQDGTDTGQYGDDSTQEERDTTAEMQCDGSES